MKRDNVSIGERIDKLGLTRKHVAKRCKIHPSNLTKIIKGVPGYGSKESVEKIHKYLDSVKT